MANRTQKLRGGVRLFLELDTFLEGCNAWKPPPESGYTQVHCQANTFGRDLFGDVGLMQNTDLLVSGAVLELEERSSPRGLLPAPADIHAPRPCSGAGGAPRRRPGVWLYDAHRFLCGGSAAVSISRREPLRARNHLNATSLLCGSLHRGAANCASRKRKMFLRSLPAAGLGEHLLQQYVPHRDQCVLLAG